MRLQPMHVRAAAIAAVLSVFSACAADGPVNPAAADLQTDAASETTSSAGVVNAPALVSAAAGSTTNSAPTAWISKPANNSSWTRGSAIAFAGVGYDAEDGQLSGSSLVWKSSIDGEIGTGKSFTLYNLSSGTHTITLTGTDSYGASFSHNRKITVSGASLTANSAPVLTVNSPANGASYPQGTNISFSGSASDAQSGALSGSSIVWGSSIAGQFGTGTAFSVSSLPVGTHTIGVVARDPQGMADTVLQTLTITAAVTAPNKDPYGLISSPAHNSSYKQGVSISFRGSASDPEDGTLSGGSIVWTSSRDGQIGTGTSFYKNNLSVGTHTISMTTTDSKGATFVHNRVVYVTTSTTTTTNQSPTATISAPSSGATATQGSYVSFSGSGSDAESGALSGSSLTWTSSRDGQIGTGTSFSKNNLSVGTHTITLTARDPQGATGTSSRSITINAPTATNTAPVANFTASCVLLVCSFDASASTDNAGIVNYAWNFGSGSIINRTTALISNTFLVAGTVNVTLTVRDAAGLTGTITKSVSMSAGTTTAPSSAGGNEPSGMSKLTETSFSCITGCGGWGYWNQNYTGAATLVQDATAPKSGSSVVHVNYTSSLHPGTAPGSFGAGSSLAAQRQTVYVSIWLKMSSNYQGHSSGVNKVLHFFTRKGTSGENVAIFVIRGSGSNTLVPSFGFQRMAMSPSEFNVNAAASTCTTQRGQWHKYEMVLQNNTPGQSNGVATLWMDGKKCVERTGLAYVASGQSNLWHEIWYSPTWGGAGGDPPSQSFYQAVDHIYVSGK